MRFAVFFSLGLLLFLGGLPLSSVCPGPQTYQGLFLQAGELRSQGQFNASFFTLQQALELARLDRKPVREGKCLIRMGILKWDLGEPDNSTSYFRDAQATFKRAGDLKAQEFCAKCLEAIRLYNLGKEDRKARLFYRSVARFEEASSQGRETGIPDFELKCLRQQALTYLDLRQFEPFLKNSRKGLRISTDIRHVIEQGRCLNHIGIYFQWHNDYSQAVTHFEKALALLSTVPDPETEAECLNNLGLVFRELGRFEQAHFYLKRALALDQGAENLNAISMDLVNIGSVNLRRGLDERRKEDLLNALEVFQNCLRLQDQGQTDPVVIFTALNNMGIILNELKDHEGARRHFKRAMNILDSRKNALERSQILSNIATSYLDEGKVEEALVHYRTAFDLSARDYLKDVLIESCVGLGKCYERLHDDLTAVSFYRRAIETIEAIRVRILSESAMIGFARNKLTPFERSIDILANRYTEQPSRERLDEIFNIVEKARARAFLESVREARFDCSSADQLILDERRQAISRNIAGLKTMLADPSNAGGAWQSLKNELELEEEEFIRVVQEAKTPGQARDCRWQGPIDHIEAVQRELSARKSVLLEYFLGNEQSFLISVSPARASLHLLPAQRKIEASLKAYLKSIADRSLDQQIGFQAAERIGRELIPIEERDELKAARTVIVVPDGILHYLPFETLNILDASRQRYLVEDASIAYCPSASALLSLLNTDSLRPRKWKKDLLAVGGSSYERGRGPDHSVPTVSRPIDEPFDFEGGIDLPNLPYSRKEIMDIAKYFPADAVDILVGDAAGEENIKAWPLKDYRIVHFACHGFLNERYPFRSALVLSSPANSEEDGFLQMREIYGLQVNAELIVLSACQTGNGLLERFEGALDLARPFFFAGARSVLASLWPVDDEATRTFMSDFYSALTDGASAADALSHTKKKMLNSRWAHPYYWAGFLLQGDPSVAELMEESAPESYRRTVKRLNRDSSDFEPPL